MRGRGQIAELARIAEPEVAVITNVGPVHVELLGSVEEIAAAKAEILAGVARPREPRLYRPTEAELEARLEGVPNLIRFGSGGDVEALESRVEDGVTEALIATPAGRQLFHFPFVEAHNLTNALAAVAAGRRTGHAARRDGRPRCEHRLLPLPGERLELGDGIVLVNDCYNANPVSMRAALDHLATLEGGRRIAVLGEMAELGSGAPGYHRSSALTRARLVSTC